MIDLTPLDVRKKRGDFRKGMRGYDTDEVDQFLATVADRLEALVKENLALQERVTRLAATVEEQTGRESAVRDALVTAQELREEIRGQARREAETTVRAAESEAEARLREAKLEAERLVQEASSEAASLLRDAEAEAQGLRDSARTAERRTREDAERALEERRRELRALSRARTRFLLSWRTLLEREVDALEVAEDAAPENAFPAKVLEGGMVDLATEDDQPRESPVVTAPPEADGDKAKPRWTSDEPVADGFDGGEA